VCQQFRRRFTTRDGFRLVTACSGYEAVDTVAMEAFERINVHEPMTPPPAQ
jgi:hypothetical protein